MTDVLNLAVGAEIIPKVLDRIVASLKIFVGVLDVASVHFR